MFIVKYNILKFTIDKCYNFGISVKDQKAMKLAGIN